jgi:hypothetical protein
MNSTETIDDNQFSEGIGLDEKVKGFLLETAKWATFLAIVGFVGLGLMVIGSIVILSIGGIPGMRVNEALILAVVYLGMAALYFFPVYYLFLFGSKMKAGLTSNSQTGITSGFENLKSHYKFLGIMMIVILSLYGFVFLIGFLMSLGR